MIKGPLKVTKAKLPSVFSACIFSHEMTYRFFHVPIHLQVFLEACEVRLWGQCCSLVAEKPAQWKGAGERERPLVVGMRTESKQRLQDEGDSGNWSTHRGPDTAESDVRDRTSPAMHAPHLQGTPRTQ